jgi:hypothetical protein
LYLHGLLMGLELGPDRLKPFAAYLHECAALLK